MTLERFVFQRECVQQVLDNDPDGFVLNVGANEDPGDLKAIDPERVLNCDLFEHDVVMGRPNKVDRLFDAAADRWPFDDQSCALVVLGDIMEHLTIAEQEHALTEARRVSRRLAITVPQDERETNNDETANNYPRGAVHRTIVTRPLLRGVLERTGWSVMEWRNVWYEFCPLGFFVACE